MSQIPPPQVPSAPGPADMPPMDAKEIEEGKVLAILGYIIGIVAIVVLILRNNNFSLYHAKQWLILLIAAFAVWIPLAIVTVLATVIAPKAAGCVMMAIYPVVWLGIIALAIMGVINAAQGQCKPLPLIGQYAETWFKGIRKQGPQA